MATQPTYIYGDTANAVLNTARSRVSDLIITPVGSPTGSDPDQQFTQVGGGTLLAELNTDSTLCLRTQIIFNSAYRKFQQYLANLGWRGNIQTLTITGIPANMNVDLSAQTWLSWNGCFNGSTFSANPALPSSFIAPLKIRERVNGTTAQFTPMITALDGLRNVGSRSVLNRQWEWRNNALWFIGATGATDLQIRCKTYYPDLAATGSPSTPWYYQIVPIPGCLTPLAWFVAYEVCFPRGDEPGASGALAQAQDEAGKLFNDQARADQRVKQINESMPQPGIAPGTAPQEPAKA